jgi:hypothetical protein
MHTGRFSGKTGWMIPPPDREAARPPGKTEEIARIARAS